MVVGKRTHWRWARRPGPTGRLPSFELPSIQYAVACRTQGTAGSCNQCLTCCCRRVCQFRPLPTSPPPLPQISPNRRCSNRDLVRYNPNLTQCHKTCSKTYLGRDSRPPSLRVFRTLRRHQHFTTGQHQSTQTYVHKSTDTNLVSPRAECFDDGEKVALVLRKPLMRLVRPSSRVGWSLERSRVALSCARVCVSRVRRRRHVKWKLTSGTDAYMKSKSA